MSNIYFNLGYKFSFLYSIFHGCRSISRNTFSIHVYVFIASRGYNQLFLFNLKWNKTLLFLL